MGQNLIGKIIIVTILIIAIGAIGYFVFFKNPTNQPGSSKGIVAKDSSFIPTKYGSKPGCVNVEFKENVTMEQAISLLKQLNIPIPTSLSNNLKPRSSFIPTIEVTTDNFEKTAAILKQDPLIADVQLNYRHISGNDFVYVLFIDSVTGDEAYRLLKDKYGLNVNGNETIIQGIKSTTLSLSIVPGSEETLVRAFRSSSIVQDALQCPIQPPDSTQ